LEGHMEQPTFASGYFSRVCLLNILSSYQHLEENFVHFLIWLFMTSFWLSCSIYSC
jgi:hypothetical protein